MKTTFAEHVFRQGITVVPVNSDRSAAHHIGAVAESTLLVESALARSRGDSDRG
jgi:hypothetical protein